MRPVRILWSQAALLRKIRQRQSRAPRTPDQRNGSAKESANRLRFLRLCEAENLPVPVYEHKFHPERKWRFDFAWPEQKVALEIDGGLYINGGHTRGSGRERDYEKDASALGMGWRVMRVSTGQLNSGDAIRWLKKVLLVDKPPG